MCNDRPEKRMVWIVIGNMTEEETCTMVMNGTKCFGQPLLKKEDMQNLGLTCLKGHHKISLQDDKSKSLIVMFH
jgi:hypothetical protein